MKRCFRVCVATLALLIGAPPLHAAVLESPARGAYFSGLGFISGWKCDAEEITVRIDSGAPIPVLYGNDRLDTHVSRGGPCQNRDTGYILQVNWAELGDGRHTVVVYDTGREFARSTFTVATAGGPFLEDVTAQCTVPDFPAPGETGHFIWNESTQHLELRVVDRPPDSVDPVPLAQSKLYWTDSTPYDGVLRRANLNGSQMETVFSRRGVFSGLAVDPVGRKLYWKSVQRGSRGDIERANLDGSQVETVVSLTDSNAYISAPAVAPHSRKLYWISDTTSTQEIRRANLDGSQAETIVRATRN